MVKHHKQYKHTDEFTQASWTRCMATSSDRYTSTNCHKYDGTTIDKNLLIMTEKIIYYPQFNHHLQGVIHLPASKSICNRVLLIQALCGDFTNISNVSESSDTQILLKSLWLIDDHAGGCASA